VAGASGRIWNSVLAEMRELLRLEYGAEGVSETGVLGEFTVGCWVI
jgi:hypothetical protein